MWPVSSDTQMSRPVETRVAFSGTMRALSQSTVQTTSPRSGGSITRRHLPLETEEFVVSLPGSMESVPLGVSEMLDEAESVYGGLREPSLPTLSYNWHRKEGLPVVDGGDRNVQETGYVADAHRNGNWLPGGHLRPGGFVGLAACAFSSAATSLRLRSARLSRPRKSASFQDDTGICFSRNAALISFCRWIERIDAICFRLLTTPTPSE